MGRKVSVTIDLDDLSKEQAEMLTEFLDDSDFFELPADLTKPTVPDSFTYNITVFKEHSVRVSDTTAPDELRPLLEALSKQARTKR